jgi:hypothetical protein
MSKNAERKKEVKKIPPCRAALWSASLSVWKKG